MSQIHLFIVDPLSGLNLRLDSSLRMACALAAAGQEIFICTAHDLSWGSQASAPAANAQALTFANATASAPVPGKRRRLLLRECQGIHMRKEPPFNNQYVAITWLLDAVASEVNIFNHPAALRACNEKLAIFRFPEAITPALVSSDCDELLAFVETHCHGDAIVKPLDLFGGRGIFRLELAKLSAAEARTRLSEATQEGKEWRLVQAFNPAIFAGELRVFALAGEPLAWCLKKPQTGSFLANTAAGATLQAFQPTPRLTAMVQSVAGRLHEAGISLVGFDIIGEVISEINVTSPRLLHTEDDKRPYYEEMARWFIKTCASRPRPIRPW